MKTTSGSVARGRSNAAKAVLAGGFAAGVLDLGAAFAQSGLRGVGPVTVLQAIASGLLGSEAFRGGLATAALGAVLHFVIASLWCGVFYEISRRRSLLLRHPLASGAVFGAGVYFVMNAVVLPLSAVPFDTTMTLEGTAIGLLIHVCCVGLPIAYVVRRFVR